MGRCGRGMRMAAWVLPVALGASATRGAGAQEWTWPERAQNLTELPANFPPERLSAVMRGFSAALGVRCTHCHVGEEGQPLSTYDFVSDANPNKDRARAMYRMLGVVNDHLRDIPPSGERVNMWCHTCHAGKPRPQTLAEAVLEQSDPRDPEATIAFFLDLRQRYFGTAAYDFTATSVDELASSLANQGDTVAAQAIVEHNAQAWPNDARALERAGDLWETRGDRARALDHFERALNLLPGSPRLAEKVRRLRLPGGMTYARTLHERSTSVIKRR